MTAYQIYAKENFMILKKALNLTAAETNKICSEQWYRMTDDEKKEYRILSEKDKQRFQSQT